MAVGLVALLLLLAVAVAVAHAAPADTLTGKVMVGYQGWAYGPELPNPWNHWTNNAQPPTTNNLVFDVWPDVSEYPSLYDTNLNYANGKKAQLHSNLDASVADTHFRWMKEYNIDGAFAQRFLTTDGVFVQRKLKVMDNIKAAAEKYGRTFAVMYDIGIGSGADLKFVEDDWDENIVGRGYLNSPMYQHHNGKPVVSVWGFGFNSRPNNVTLAKAFVSWLRAKGLYVMGGVPFWWRTGDHDSWSGWDSLYADLDLISPWAVGRWNSNTSFDSLFNQVIVPDAQAIIKSNQAYAPVIFPGFSWANLMKDPTIFNQIPRNCGQFISHQIKSLVTIHHTFIYVAMFDEVDEGTAIYKAAASADAVPQGAQFLHLSKDPCGAVPSDHYLKIVGAIPRTSP
jgi:hypothetical protein